MAYQKLTVSGDSLDDVLNSVMLLGPYLRSGLPVGGETLIVRGTTVTFPGSAGSNVPLLAVMTALRAVSGLTVAIRTVAFAASVETATAYLAVSHGAGFTIGAAGTANADFGLPTDRDTIGAAPISAANIQNIMRTPSGDYDVYLGNSDGPWINYDGTALTLNASHAGGYIRTTSAQPNTITIPLNFSALEIGASISGVQIGAGRTTFVKGDPSIIINHSSTLTTTAAGSAWTLYKAAANEYDLSGDL